VPTTDPAQRLLAAVTYLADDGIIETDLDGRVTTWSKGAERLFGYPRRKCSARRWRS
jgi:PAS domain S-box-containing protein